MRGSFHRGFVPGDQSLSWSASSDSQLIAKSLAISDPDLLRELVDLDRRMPARCGARMLLHRTAPSMAKCYRSKGSTSAGTAM